MAQCFCYRKIRIVQSYIFTYDSYCNIFARIQNFMNHFFPCSHIARTFFKTQFLNDNIIKPLILHHQWYFIDGITRLVFNYGCWFYIAEQCQLFLHFVGNMFFTAAYQNIWLNTNTAQFFYAMLGRFCF